MTIHWNAVEQYFIVVLASSSAFKVLYSFHVIRDKRAMVANRGPRGEETLHVNVMGVSLQGYCAEKI